MRKIWGESGGGVRLPSGARGSRSRRDLNTLGGILRVSYALLEEGTLLVARAPSKPYAWTSCCSLTAAKEEITSPRLTST